MNLRSFYNIGIKVGIKQFVNSRRKKGHPLLLILWSFFPYAIKQIRRFTIHRNNNLIYGSRKFNIPVLVSFPRSGTNWIRFILESVSGQKTPGMKRLNSTGNLIIDRAHCAKKFGNQYAGMILVLRDYKECFMRHHPELWKQHQDIEKFISERFVISKPSWYIENIEVFDQFTKPKLLLYYEDLVTQPKVAAAQLCEFLNLDKHRTTEFIDNIELEKSKSVQSYHKTHFSHTAGDSGGLSHHANNLLTRNQIQQFDTFYEKKYPQYWEKYLKRYKA